jgi:hypothetical protein
LSKLKVRSEVDFVILPYILGTDWESQCNGRHPTCYRCHARDLECVYDVSEGMTKRQHLNNELSEQKEELTRAKAVLRVLQFGTDQEATASLARLRIGSTVSQEYQLLQTQALPPASGSETAKVLDNAIQRRAIPVPSSSQSDAPIPWTRPSVTEPYPAARQYEWDDSASEQLADWMQPLSPVSKDGSTAAVYNSADSPFFDKSLPTPGSEAPADERAQCIGG